MIDQYTKFLTDCAVNMSKTEADIMPYTSDNGVVDVNTKKSGTSKQRLIHNPAKSHSDSWPGVSAEYQMLPGAETAKICMFFGHLIGRRLGSIVAGVGFIVSGFLAMVLLSNFYTITRLKNVYFNASFCALQPVVAAMVLNAVFEIGKRAFVTSGTKKFNCVLFFLVILDALRSALRISYLITLGVFGIIYNLWARGWRWTARGLVFLNCVRYVLYVVFKGVPSLSTLALGIVTMPDMLHPLVLGLVVEILSFGGAYTSIPFVQAETDSRKKTLWKIEYPFSESVLMALGMFLPCFLFTILGHAVLERIFKNEAMASFFDGITGSVVGTIAITAMDILKAWLQLSICPSLA
ncbi:hypothetical protein BGX26_011919 [Mortierella sp. AD094]|nr:hypothetical protein BGX26_011919 [Mortierella sp. AD094]